MGVGVYFAPVFYFQQLEVLCILCDFFLISILGIKKKKKKKNRRNRRKKEERHKVNRRTMERHKEDCCVHLYIEFQFSERSNLYTSILTVTRASRHGLFYLL